MHDVRFDCFFVEATNVILSNLSSPRFNSSPIEFSPNEIWKGLSMESNAAKDSFSGPNFILLQFSAIRVHGSHMCREKMNI